MSDNNSWEREVVTQLAEASLKEQRRSRRWGIIFKLLTFAYIGIVIYMFNEASNLTTASVNEKHTALVELTGVIADTEKANADDIVTALRNAFENENTAGVILRINSPGGSPVQSGYIYDEMQRLRDEYPDTPLYAVITDICASGGYYIASAADKIYADKASIVGSIGVRMDNFGFVDAIEKLGIERRTLTAGKNKALLDPFLPVNEKAKEHLQVMLSEIHKQFIDSVKKGRGDRLNTDVDGLFSGLIWTGEAAVKNGLIDELASAGYVAREVIGEETIVDYTIQDDILQRFTDRLGSTVAQVISTQFLTPKLK
ncbi:Periplasmic serine proteases (ClpP class) [hydrothermal vent metagenome]|uniref:Periplasmic serine proteases (ClpP class) n=1 Tax=hydrothermal vent metagenome TaxID=652676 RepID=A0A3B0X1G7_9ZZZZ